MMDVVSNPAVIMSSFMFGITGIACYLTYGDYVQSNILLTFPDSNAVKIAQFLLLFVVTAGFPLQIHPARFALGTLTQDLIRRLTGQDAAKWYSGGFPVYQFWINTLILLATTFSIGLSFSDLGLLYNLLGAITNTGLTFYIPGFLFFKLFEAEAAQPIKDTENHPPKDVGQSGSEHIFASIGWLRFHRGVALFMGILGIFLTPLTLAAALLY